MPYIQYNDALASGDSATLTIEYYSADRVTLPTPTLSVAVASVIVPSPFHGNRLSIRRSLMLADGSVLVEFDTIRGKQYLVEYSADMNVWKQALPPMAAPGTRFLWIDSGPPKTETRPSASGTRFYRVIELQ